jgi:hypothetical protein
VPPFDDVGFTHDNVVAVSRQRGTLIVGGTIVERWITSARDRRRWDQLDVLATGERAWPHRLATMVRLGPTFGGNLGGRFMQDRWHSLSGTGPTIDEGLADDYPGSRRVALLAGVRARIQVGEDALHGYGVLDGQLALGSTGVTSGESALGGSINARHVGASAELAITRYHSRDPNLLLPGAYGAGWQLEWRIGVHAAWSRYRVAYQYRANEGGSGEPIGVLAFHSAW